MIQMTDKKLRVCANINIAYIINYLNKYCNYSQCNAFYIFIKSKTYAELTDLHSGLCTAIAPEILFMFADEYSINIPEDDDKINEAFNISERLQYIVNITEAFRYNTKLSLSEYIKYAINNSIWEYIDKNYNMLSPLKRDDVIKKIISKD